MLRVGFLRPSRYRRHQHGLGDISSRDRSRHRRHPLRASSRARAATVGIAAFHDLFTERLKAALEINQLVEVPGARALLRALREDARFELAIATGAWRRSAILKLAAAEIDIAGLVFASADDAVDRGEIVRKAMVQLAGGVDRAIFVGDGLWDVATASRLGLGFLGIGGGERAAALRGAGAGWVLADFLDTPAVVEKLWATAMPFNPSTH
jgi:phosphoglycolate phosphatase-like HAD superfamily hydrolase